MFSVLSFYFEKKIVEKFSFFCRKFFWSEKSNLDWMQKVFTVFLGADVSFFRRSNKIDQI